MMMMMMMIVIVVRTIMKIEEGVVHQGRRPRQIAPSEISIILHKILSLIH